MPNSEEGGLDELLEKARSEAETKKPTDEAVSEKESKAPEVPGAIDGLLSEIKTEKADTVEHPASFEEETKLKAAFEKIKPEVEKLAGLLIVGKQLDSGKMDYAALTRNAGAYIEARKDDVKIDIASEKSYKSIEPELGFSPSGYDRMKLFNLIREAANYTVMDNILSYRDYFHSSGERNAKASLEFWEKGRPDASPKSAAQNEMLEKVSRLNQGLGLDAISTLDAGAKGKIENPDDYIPVFVTFPKITNNLKYTA